MEDDKKPTSGKQRYVILDALRGLALLGIALANFPEFGLWTFLAEGEQAALTGAEADGRVRLVQYMLVDGKFYTIFSLLFGVGFSLILRKHGRGLFVRRMLILVAIGLLHLMFLWSGDILLLYAVGGLLLTLFVRWSDKALLWVAAGLIVLPVALEALTEFRGVDFAAPFYDLWWTVAGANGIREDNFATWLRDATSYREVFAFLQQGACERLWEFVGGHRLPKVLGLFLLGYVIGKRQLYARLRELPLKGVLRGMLLPALALSCGYAWSSTEGHPWGDMVHALLYAASVIPLAFCYICLFALCYQRWPEGLPFRLLAAPGRMALSNYIGQSVVGIGLFYGVGLGLGTSLCLWQIELVAVGVFVVQIGLSGLWLRWFRFGPLEWLWRMLTYGRWLPLR